MSTVLRHPDPVRGHVNHGQDATAGLVNVVTKALSGIARSGMSGRLRVATQVKLLRLDPRKRKPGR